jgi:hypothetical protein
MYQSKHNLLRTAVAFRRCHNFYMIKVKNLPVVTKTLSALPYFKRKRYILIPGGIQ